MHRNEWTLTEVARLLQQPQHRLIYLCEKGVIVPEFADAQGRGTSRRFSARNIFEFSITLALSEFHFPATISVSFLYAVRYFETQVKANGTDDFSLPDSLTKTNSPEIIAIITNGSVLYLSLGRPGRPKSVFGGVDIGGVSGNSDLSNIGLESQNAENISGNSGGSTIASDVARFEINLTKIAQNLELD